MCLYVGDAIDADRVLNLSRALRAHLYDLFNVVVHEGKLNTGHYYCYFRWRDAWYLANDDNVQPAKLQDVLSCKAYQLCYKRRNLQNVRQGT